MVFRPPLNITDANPLDYYPCGNLSDRNPTGSGSADFFGFPNGPTLWKRGADNTVKIRYSYYNRIARDTVQPEFESAIIHWKNAIGTKKNRHALSFEEVLIQGNTNNPEYCEGGPDGQWNNRLPFETVAVKYDPTRDGANACMGRNPRSDTEPWFNYIHIGVNVKTFTIAHEVSIPSFSPFNVSALTVADWPHPWHGSRASTERP